MRDKIRKIMPRSTTILAVLLILSCIILIAATFYSQQQRSTTTQFANSDKGTTVPISAAEVVLSDDQAENAASLHAANLFPGDSQTKRYQVKITYQDRITLCFDTTVGSGSEKLSEVMKIKVHLPSTGELLYDGPIDTMPTLTHTLTSPQKVTQDIPYDVTIYLDPSADQSYQNLDFDAGLHWWASETEDLHSTIVRRIVTVLLVLGAAGTGALVLTVLIEERRDKGGQKYA